MFGRNKNLEIYKKLLKYVVLGISCGMVLGFIFGFLIGYISEFIVLDNSEVEDLRAMGVFFGMAFGAIIGSIFGGLIVLKK